MANWVYLTLTATLLWSCTNVLDKYILSKRVSKPFLPLIFLSIIGLISALLIFLMPISKSLPPFYLLTSILSGVFYTFAILLYFKAIMKEEVSKIVALWHITPVFTAFFGVLFLNEILSVYKYIGIVLIVCGALLIELKNFQLQTSYGLKLMIVSSFFLSLHIVSTKIALQEANFWTVFAWVRIGIFLTMLFFIYPKKEEIRKELSMVNIITIALMSASETINILGIILITAATAKGFITLISALASIQPLFVYIIITAMSLFFPKILKETVHKKNTLARLAAICCIITGAILVV